MIASRSLWIFVKLYHYQVLDLGDQFSNCGISRNALASDFFAKRATWPLSRGPQQAADAPRGAALITCSVWG